MGSFLLILIEMRSGRSRGLVKRRPMGLVLSFQCNLFGIRKFNNTPKLLFNDMLLKAEYRDLKTCFSIDTKAAIDSNGVEPESNPRTYKTTRVGLEFEGVIELYRFGMDYIIYNLKSLTRVLTGLGIPKVVDMERYLCLSWEKMGASDVNNYKIILKATGRITQLPDSQKVYCISKVWTGTV